MIDPNRMKALQQKRAEASAEAERLLIPAEGADGLTAEATTAFDAKMAQIAGYDRELAAIASLQEAERNAPAVGRSPVSVHLNAEDDLSRGFQSIEDFGLAVRAASAGGSGRFVDPRLSAAARLAAGMGGSNGIEAAPTNFHRETGSDDGWEVPPMYRDQIWSLVYEGDDLLSLVNAEPTNSNSVELLADESTPWGATGIQAYWAGEGVQMTPSRLATEGRQVKLHKLHAYVLATDELLEDAPRLASRLTVGAARAIEWKSSEAIMNGTGVGQPLGWNVAASLVTVAKETSQTAATVAVANIGKMYARLLRNPGARPTWFATSDIVPQLIGLAIGNQPVWTGVNGGMKEAPTGTLLGIPIRFTEHTAALGTVGDLQLVDLNGYYAAKRSTAPQYAESIHLFFDYGIKAFRWTFRFGGQPFLSAAVTAKNGTSKSHAVVLATRA